MQVIDVPASQGWLWIKDAWRLFKGAPLGWMSLAGGWLILVFLVRFIPFVGFFTIPLQPAFSAGCMIACRDQENGGSPNLSHLFAAFRGNLRALVVVGFVTFAGELAILMLLGALGFPTLSLSGDGESIDFVAYSVALEEKAWIVFLAMVLTSLFKGAMWFAPTILAFNKMSAGAAIRWSLYAFLSNFGAMFFYWILVAAMYFLALLPSGAGLFIAIPLTLISSYTGYTAMFREEPEEVAPAPPPAPAI